MSQSLGVRYAGFTPRSVNQAGAQGEEAGREIANGGARQRRRRGKMHKRRAYRVVGLLWDYYERIMRRIMKGWDDDIVLWYDAEDDVD